jgi:hypothetical protein
MRHMNRRSFLSLAALAGASAVDRLTVRTLAQGQPERPMPEAVVPDRVMPLFNGKDLTGWWPDVPTRDKDPKAPDSFITRNGMLVSLGTPRGHLLTDGAYRDYRVEVEYRFPGKPGNCGVLVHASRLRALSRSSPPRLRCR